MVRKRKIIVSMASSTDGYIARPDGSVDWLDRPSPKGHYGMEAFYKSIDTILWGRKTYEVALEFQRKAYLDRRSIGKSRTSFHAHIAAIGCAGRNQVCERTD